MTSRTTICAVAFSVLMTIGVSACQSERPGGKLILTIEANDSVTALQRINERAQKCWKGDKAFRAYRVIPELDTSAGRPRLLVVKSGAAEGLPQLVIEAEGSPVKISTFGPLTEKKLSNRINADIARWSGGENRCAS